jgi:prolyl 4-hydroxylase
MDFGVLMDDRIDLRYINNFLSTEECEHLIKISRDKFAPSQVISDTNDKIDKTTRTSHSFYISKSSDDIIKRIENKVSKLLNRDVEYIEGLQVVNYKPGDFFKEHHDYFHEPYLSKIKNQREFTFFVYLNNFKGNGGQTSFPLLNKEFYPKKGDALFWRNCENINSCYNLSLHQGKAPEIDEKTGLNIWVRFKPV